jgi:hypothetical protein
MSTTSSCRPPFAEVVRLPNEAVDVKFYEVASPRSLGERLLVVARDRIFDDFLRLCRPQAGDSILDVGVSDVVNDGANVLERKYPYPERITAAGLGEGTAFRREFPRTTYVRIEANRPLPFADRAISIATANAVLEHVGSRANQLAFVRELSRVARKVFITVPNRLFPIEHHTAIPLLHYWEPTFAIACAAFAKREWARKENLILTSKRSLAALVAPSVRHSIGYTGIPLGMFSSNLFLFIDQDEA